MTRIPARLGHWLAALAMALAAAAPAGASAATEALQVTVSDVLDGDTVVVQGMDQRVRLASIDAPEVGHGRRRPSQPFGIAATRWLQQALVGRSGVTMRCVDEDRYRRPVCEFHREGRNINREIVRAGLAWANTSNRRYVRDPQVIDAQREAQQARSGIWSQPHPIAPWEWRRNCWSGQQCSQ